MFTVKRFLASCRSRKDGGRQYGCLTAGCSSSALLDSFEDDWRCFHLFSISMMVAANTAILYKTMMFFYPNQEFVVCKSSQSRKIENIKTRLVLNYLRFCRTVPYIFILASGLKVSLVEMLVSVNHDQVFIFYKSSLVF